jgi:acylphosphatase
MVQTISLTISGRVQGVYYRQSAKEKAQELGITGSVKNMPNGDVFLVATGASEQLKQLIEWCRIGPSRAVVNRVQVQQIEDRSFSGFTINR